MEENYSDDIRDSIEASARYLYGLIHARFITTSRGQTKMVQPLSLLPCLSPHRAERDQSEKFRKAEFGRCPRVLCAQQPVLPVGLSDIPYQKAVKLYCPRCEDVYTPRSSRHGQIDGAYFGTSFPHMLFMACPGLLPAKRPSPTTQIAVGSAAMVSTVTVAESVDRYRPRMFGFVVHDVGRLQRWQEAQRNKSASLIDSSVYLGADSVKTD